MNVRRLAAIDMWGTHGTPQRRRLILVEFTFGFLIAVAFGAWIVTASSSIGGRLLGAWIVGVGLNYAPLAVYAFLLTSSGALGKELAGVDTFRELRRYSVLQLWIFVPLVLLVFAARRELLNRRQPNG